MRDRGIAEDRTGESNAAAAASLGAVLLFWGIWTFFWVELDIFKMPNRDLLYYGGSVCIGFLLFIWCYSIFAKSVKFAECFKECALRENILAGITFMGMGIGILYTFVNPYMAAFLADSYMGGQHKKIIAAALNIGVFAAAVEIYWYFTKQKGKKTGRETETMSDKAKWAVRVAYLLAAVNAGWLLYMPNPFKMDLYHFNAYFHSIKRALDMAPYSAINTGVYGFYGILCAPIVRLMGGSVTDMALFTAVLTGISVLCLCYVLDFMVSKPVFKILGAIGIGTFPVWERGGGYCQVFPHRIIFVSVLLAYTVWGIKHIREQKRWIFLWKMGGTILCAFSLVWNFETGIACLTAWAGWDIVGILQKEPLWNKKSADGIGKSFLQAGASLLLAYGIVNLYNLSVGGQWLTVKECLFPLVGTGDGYMQWHEIYLPKEISPWMFCIVILLGSMALVLSRTGLCGHTSRQEEVNPQIAVLAACVIAVMVQFTYYVNRSSFLLLWEILPVFAVIMAYLGERFLCGRMWRSSALGSGILRSFGVWTVVSLALLALLVCIRYISVWERQSELREMESLQEFAEEVRENIPEGTPGAGIGVDEVYSFLGWKTHSYGIDLPDLEVVQGGAESYLRAWEAENAIFVNDEYLNTVYWMTGGDFEGWQASHTITAVIYCEGIEFRLYVKK